MVLLSYSKRRSILLVDLLIDVDLAHLPLEKGKCAKSFAIIQCISLLPTILP